MSVRILVGDCRHTLKSLPEKSIQTCITSPPYWGLREYPGDDLIWGGSQSHHHIFDSGTKECSCGAWSGKLGNESTPEDYVNHIVECFREVHRVLRDDGTLWLNLGSSYAGSHGNGYQQSLHNINHTSGGKQNYDLGKKIGRSEARVSSRQRPLVREHQGVYDTYDITPSSYLDGDLFSSGLCDECREVLIHHTSRIDDQPARELDVYVSDPNPAHMDLNCSCSDSSDCPHQIVAPRSNHATHGQLTSISPVIAQPPSFQGSMTDESSRQPLVECSHCSNCDVCLSILDSSSRDARLCARKLGVGIENGRYIERTVLPDAQQEPGIRYKAIVLPYVHPQYTKIYKPKDMINIPAMVAEALREDGWYLRSQIPWIKRNCFPESVSDRPSSAIEYVYLLSKCPKYYYDVEAVKGPTRRRRNSDWIMESFQGLLLDEAGDSLAMIVNPSGFEGAHYATFAPKFVEPMIKASTKTGDKVIDCFGGAATVSLVADRLGRDGISCELSEDYSAISDSRLVDDSPMFADVTKEHVSPLPELRDSIIDPMTGEEYTTIPLFGNM